MLMKISLGKTLGSQMTLFTTSSLERSSFNWYILPGIVFLITFGDEMQDTNKLPQILSVKPDISVIRMM